MSLLDATTIETTGSLEGAAGAGVVGRPGVVARALLVAIRGYRLARFGRPTGCRFIPSCSSYGTEAVERHGAWHGTGLALRRLLRCGPWGGSGFDPVPDRQAP